MRRSNHRKQQPVPPAKRRPRRRCRSRGRERLQEEAVSREYPLLPILGRMNASTSPPEWLQRCRGTPFFVNADKFEGADIVGAMPESHTSQRDFEMRPVAYKYPLM
ncbi:hypothetical protein MPLA_2130058 [Mesorhizobium sp. ORS 3359]|nr:hypothetical protein MPLA_2130058 [Mesorhizobium sp. ORS 3359]